MDQPPPQESKFDDLECFRALKPYVDRVARGSATRNKLFSLCVRASLSKCYEFNLALREDLPDKYAFFAIGTLRGICEDIIVLRYISKMPPVDRDALIAALMDYDIVTGIKQQERFFTAVRPYQRVLRASDVDRQIANASADARAVWQRHGWPSLNKGAMPPTEQIARKQGNAILAIFYDYLYRMTSRSVHFNVLSLFRSGWGARHGHAILNGEFHRLFLPIRNALRSVHVLRLFRIVQFGPPDRRTYQSAGRQDSRETALLASVAGNGDVRRDEPQGA